MALIGLLYEQKSVNTQDMSLLLAFMIAPIFFFNPIAGICVDLWDRKITMIVSDCLRGLLLCLLPFVILLSPDSWGLYPVYAMVFCIFSVARFFIPAKSAIIPEIMDAKDLRTANAISATSKMLATVFGVIGGGAIVTLLGATMCFYLNGLCFFVSAFSLAWIRRVHPVKRASSTDQWQGRIQRMNHELRDGFAELWTNPNIFYLVKVVSVIMFAGGAVFVAFPIFVHHHYGVMAHGLAILIASLGGGLFLGAVSVARSSKMLDHKALFSWSITIVAILFYAFVMVKPFMIATVLMFLIGLFGAPIAICTETMIQDFVDDYKIGRVYSAIEMVIHVVFLIAMTGAGYLGKIWDVGVVLMLSVIVSALLFAIVWQKERRRDLRV